MFEQSWGRPSSSDLRFFIHDVTETSSCFFCRVKQKKHQRAQSSSFLHHRPSARVSASRWRRHGSVCDLLTEKRDECGQERENHSVLPASLPIFIFIFLCCSFCPLKLWILLRSFGGLWGSHRAAQAPAGRPGARPQAPADVRWAEPQLEAVSWQETNQQQVS